MTATEQSTIQAPETGPFVCAPDHPHDRFNTCYRTHGCRCRPCKTREARRKAAERARKKAGRQEPLVDPQWALGHIEALQLMGMTRRDIARCAGVNEATVHRIADRKGQKLFPQTARAILAVRPESAAWRTDKAWVNSTGTIRRIQALMAIGYSGNHISMETGHGPEWATRLLATMSDRVEEQSRVRVAAAYERLSMTRPEGVYAERTRAFAARRGYAPPLAWDDDIDDPAARPDIDGSTGTAELDAVTAAIEGQRPELTPEERGEVITVLNGRRWSADKIAAHIGCSAKTVERVRAKLGLPIYLANGSHYKDGTVAA